MTCIPASDLTRSIPVIVHATIWGYKENRCTLINLLIVTNARMMSIKSRKLENNFTCSKRKNNPGIQFVLQIAMLVCVFLQEKYSVKKQVGFKLVQFSGDLLSQSEREFKQIEFLFQHSGCPVFEVLATFIIRCRSHLLGKEKNLKLCILKKKILIF